MRVLITGAGGQVGHELVSVFGAGGHEVAGFDHARLDITNRDAVRAAVVEFQPDAIVHSAAWTAVDACESDPNRAFAVNAMGTRFVVDTSSTAPKSRPMSNGIKRIRNRSTAHQSLPVSANSVTTLRSFVLRGYVAFMVRTW
jgi:nucleoside-diphosphate-sugar epimerase